MNFKDFGWIADNLERDFVESIKWKSSYVYSFFILYQCFWINYASFTWSEFCMWIVQKYLNISPKIIQDWIY